MKNSSFNWDCIISSIKAHPPPKPSYLSSPTLSAELMRLSRGVLQTIVQLVTHAAAHAVESREDRITAALLARAMIEPPLAAARQAAHHTELRKTYASS